MMTPQFIVRPLGGVKLPRARGPMQAGAVRVRWPQSGAKLGTWRVAEHSAELNDRAQPAGYATRFKLENFQSAAGRRAR